MSDARELAARIARTVVGAVRAMQPPDDLAPKTGTKEEKVPKERDLVAEGMDALDRQLGPVTAPADDEGLVCFLYVLMRDAVPLGTVAGILKEHVEPGAGQRGVYTNKPLETYAREVARRILAAGVPR